MSRRIIPCTKATSGLSPVSAPVLLGKDLYGSPTSHFIRAALILIAADVEPPPVSVCGAVLADVAFTIDLHERAELERRRTGDCIMPAANIGAGGREAGMTARLRSDCVEASDVRAQLVILATNRILLRDKRLRGPYGEP
jgi:hypothetical protein